MVRCGCWEVKCSAVQVCDSGWGKGQLGITTVWITEGCKCVHTMPDRADVTVLSRPLWQANCVQELRPCFEPGKEGIQTS
jgi:hypothetical protein